MHRSPPQVIVVGSVDALAAMMLAAVGSSDQSKRIVKSLSRSTLISESWSSNVNSMKNKALLASANKTALFPTKPLAAAGDITS